MSTLAGARAASKEPSTIPLQQAGTTATSSTSSWVGSQWSATGLAKTPDWRQPVQPFISGGYRRLQEGEHRLRVSPSLRH